jgi:hypothetical protein
LQLAPETEPPALGLAVDARCIAASPLGWFLHSGIAFDLTRIIMSLPWYWASKAGVLLGIVWRRRVISRSVESRSSWVIATVALAVLTISYGAPLVTVAAMKPIVAELGDAGL